MSEDRIRVKILKEGTIKIVTDEISAPNHTSAAELVKQIARLAGGETTIEKRTDHHEHGHFYEEEQEQSQ